MTPEHLTATIRDVLAETLATGEVKLPDGVPEHVIVERPRSRDHGDYATNVALQLAKSAGIAPRHLAELLATRLRKVDGIDVVEVAGPGFLNITFRRGRRASSRGPSSKPVNATDRRLDDRRASQPRVRLGQPTGPLHMGGTRWAAVGDSLAQAVGAAAVRTSRGSTTSTTTERRSTGSPVVACRGTRRADPEDGYGGDYIGEIAAADRGRGTREVLDLPESEAQESVSPSRASS